MTISTWWRFHAVSLRFHCDFIEVRSKCAVSAINAINEIATRIYTRTMKKFLDLRLISQDLPSYCIDFTAQIKEYARRSIGDQRRSTEINGDQWTGFLLQKLQNVISPSILVRLTWYWYSIEPLQQSFDRNIFRPTKDETVGCFFEN